MSRIQKTFENNKAFISFLTAGDPSIDISEELILTVADAGSDLIEIGIPFSDPVAEGAIIEKANLRALQTGTTTDKIFDMVKRVRAKTSVPLVFLTYINPVFVYGKEKFFANCRECGIDGIIIPDLPYEEKSEVMQTAEQYGVDIITLIAPTSENRIQMLARSAKGFIYLVSSMGVTGVRSEIKTDLATIISDIRAVTSTPVAVGFGISTQEQARSIAQLSDGVIVGSAIVKIIEQYGENAVEPLREYVMGMKKAVMK